MSTIYWAGAAFVAGVVAGFMMVGLDARGSLDACRAANPGYECSIGWIKDAPFK